MRCDAGPEPVSPPRSAVLGPRRASIESAVYCHAHGRAATKIDVGSASLTHYGREVAPKPGVCEFSQPAERKGCFAHLTQLYIAKRRNLPSKAALEIGWEPSRLL
jgi:hypothetical protein